MKGHMRSLRIARRHPLSITRIPKRLHIPNKTNVGNSRRLTNHTVGLITIPLARNFMVRGTQRFPLITLFPLSYVTDFESIKGCFRTWSIWFWVDVIFSFSNVSTAFQYEANLDFLCKSLVKITTPGNMTPPAIDSKITGLGSRTMATPAMAGAAAMLMQDNSVLNESSISVPH